MIRIKYAIIMLSAIGLLLLSSCQKDDLLNSVIPETEQSQTTLSVEEDMKNVESTEDSEENKGSKDYCEALEQKMKTFDKESKEMEAAWKLYKLKCHDCDSKKEDKENENEESYCSSLKSKLKEFDPSSEEYLEIKTQLAEKCSEKQKEYKPK